MNSVNSPITNTVDDNDLDDAALRAVIDSVATFHSPSKHRETVSIKYPNEHSPPIPVSHPSSPPKLPHQVTSHHWRFASPCQDYQRPYKMGKSWVSRVSETSLMLIVKRTPIAPQPYRWPETYFSLGLGGFDSGNESVFSPRRYVRCEEKEGVKHSLFGQFPSVEQFKEYQNAAMAMLVKCDYTMRSGNPFIKKSDKSTEFDENRSVQRAELVVRAYMQGGRFSDGWGSCERRERRFVKANHDISSTAEIRAKNKACQDLVGIGEYRPWASQFQR